VLRLSLQLTRLFPAGRQLRYQSPLLESDSFSGSQRLAQSWISTMRNDMDDDLKGSAFGANFAKAPFPVYFVLMTLVMLGTPVMLIMLKS